MGGALYCGKPTYCRPGFKGLHVGDCDGISSLLGCTQGNGLLTPKKYTIYSSTITYLACIAKIDLLTTTKLGPKNVNLITRSNLNPFRRLTVFSSPILSSGQVVANKNLIFIFSLNVRNSLTVYTSKLLFSASLFQKCNKNDNRSDKSYLPMYSSNRIPSDVTRLGLN